MAKQIFDFILAETIEEGWPKVCTAPENWIIDGKLYWPPKDVYLNRRKQTPPGEGWTVYECKLLGQSFASLKDALAKEKSYEQFSNTESEKEYQKKKQQKRKHPVTFDLIDANNEFDAVKSTENTKKPAIEDIHFEPILPDELLSCQYLSDEPKLLDVGKAMGSTIVSNEFDLQSNQTSTRLNQFDSVLIQYPQTNEYPALPNQCLTQLNQYVQPSQYFLQPSQHHFQNSQYTTDLSPHPFERNNYLVQNPVQCNQYPVQPKQTPANQILGHSNQIRAGSDNTAVLHQFLIPSSFSNYTNIENKHDSLDKGKVIVSEQYSLGSNNYSCPKKNTTDSIPIKKNENQQASIDKRKEVQMNHGNIKKIERENRVLSKSVNGKAKSKRMESSTKCLQNKKTSLKPIQSKQLNKSKDSIQETEKLQSQPGTSSLAEYVNTFIPSPNHNITENATQAEYLPLIYKELLEIKALCKSNQIETNENSKEIKNICEKLASTIEEDDPFADGSMDTFDAEFPKREKKTIKAFELRLLEEPSTNKKLGFKFRSIAGEKPRTMIRACMRYIICDSLLQKYTWKGTRKKPGFVNLTQICKILFSSVSNCFRKYTKSKFNTYMSDYIKQAKNRYKRSLEKESVGNESTSDEDDQDNGKDEESSEFEKSGEENKDEDEDEDDCGDEDGYEDGDENE